MGGWLDHIGCVWSLDNGQAAAEESLIQQEKITGCKLVITNPSSKELFRKEFEFEFKITFVQCFKISESKKSNNNQNQLDLYRILVFTTDLIY